MQLTAFREIREVQASCDVNAYLDAKWLLIECQKRQATDALGADGYFVFLVGSTDHSWDPFADESAEFRYQRALKIVRDYEASRPKLPLRIA